MAFCPPLSGNAYAKNAPKADQVGVFGLEDKSEAEDLGVEWTRQPLWWNTYENKKDKIDRMVKDLEGVKAVLTIRCVHPIKTVCPDSAIPSLRSQMSCPPRNLEEYKDFVRSVVRKYKDKVAAWQIENEVYATRKYWVEDERGSIEQFYPVFQAAYYRKLSFMPPIRTLCFLIGISEDNFSLISAPKPLQDQDISRPASPQNEDGGRSKALCFPLLQ